MKRLFMKNLNFKSQWLNALALYLVGVMSLAMIAYGCKWLLAML
jgi:hypothetical protein